MYVGTQVGNRDDDDLRVWAQLGVNNICNDPREGNAHTWTRDDLAQWREHVQLIWHRVGHDSAPALIDTDREG